MIAWLYNWEVLKQAIITEHTSTKCWCWCASLHSIYMYNYVFPTYILSFLHLSSICILCWTVLVYTTSHQWAWLYSMCFSIMPIPFLRCLYVVTLLTHELSWVVNDFSVHGFTRIFNLYIPSTFIASSLHDFQTSCTCLLHGFRTTICHFLHSTVECSSC